MSLTRSILSMLMMLISLAISVVLFLSIAINVFAGGSPEINIVPQQIRVGEDIAIKGSGFEPNKSLSLIVKIGSEKITDTSILIEKDGTFKNEFTVEGNYAFAGTKNVEVTIGEQKYTLSFEVVATLNIDSLIANPKDIINISGKGFHKNIRLDVSVDNTTIDNPIIKTDNSGAFSAQIRIPEKIAAGDVDLMIEDSSSQSPISVEKTIRILPNLSSSGGMPIWELIAIIVGAALIILILGYFGYNYFSNRTSSAYSIYQQSVQEPTNTSLMNRIRTLTNEKTELNRRLNEYENYERLKPGAMEDYFRMSSELKQSHPTLADGKLQFLFSKPPDDYRAIKERNTTIYALQQMLNADVSQVPKLKGECLALLNHLKDDDPALYETIINSIEKAEAEGLMLIKPILVQLNQRGSVKEISPEIKYKLEEMERSLEKIRDYRLLLIPSQLAEFAKDLIKNPASEKENSIREKMVLKIIELVNKYLSL
jgi:hypothetical protein